MTTLRTISIEKTGIRSLAKKTVRLERTGRYEDALQLFGEGADQVGFVPETRGLGEEGTAELLLRYGSLIGFHAFKNQIKGGQDHSKDLLTRALLEFEKLGNTPKVVECMNYIALCYWRTGELKEAADWIDAALSKPVPEGTDSRLYSFVTRSLIFSAARRHEENIETCLAVEAEFRKYGDAFLNGSLCTNLGLSYKNSGMAEEATRYLTLAGYFHERSRHKIYLGTVYNNLALLYKEQRRFNEGEEAVAAAIKAFHQLRDHNREGSTYDSKAQILLSKGDFPAALTAADRAVAILKKVDNSLYLAEAYMTRAKILIFLERFTDAVLSLVEAVNLTRVQEGEAAVRRMVEEFSLTLAAKNAQPEPEAVEEGELELILPPSLGAYATYKAVWINSPHLERYGLRPGTLAIVVPEQLRRGDLAAVAETGSGNVICGVYDSEFGIVCLERGDEEPQLFNEDDIRVIGKIIGVCAADRDADGKMIVEPLSR